jgi:Protein of unknown function (DUF664)
MIRQIATTSSSLESANPRCRSRPVRCGVPSQWIDEQRQYVDDFIDGYRIALHDCLNDLTEEEARRRLVRSRTTLLGLVKHACYVEGVWFDHAVTGRSYADIGIATTVNGSFTLSRADTIASVQAAYRARWAVSRANLHGRRNDEIVNGRGERAVWALRLHVMRELAQHAGHADILREQILANRPPVP